MNRLMPVLSACFAISACGGQPDATGELSIAGEPDEIAAGETITISWNVKYADRVYLSVETDDGEPVMLTAEALPPVGSREIEVDPSVLGGTLDDDATLTFKLKTMDDEPGDYDTLDEESVEVSVRGAG